MFRYRHPPHAASGIRHRPVRRQDATPHDDPRAFLPVDRLECVAMVEG
ncbi:hypothetical protein [Sphingobium sp. Sx8-8]|nr:hypothetical protein [Sphingobium sp. Sx8-8]